MMTPTDPCLSPREAQAVALVTTGHKYREAGEQMGIETSTVGVLIHRARRKYAAVSRPAGTMAQLTTQAAEDHLIPSQNR